MRRGVTATSLILLAGSLIGFAAASNAATKQPPTASPQAADPTSVDFARLRAEFGGRSDFSDMCERDRPLHRLAELVHQQHWTDVLAASAPWLQQCPIDIDAHLIRAIALKELGRAAESDHHAEWFRGLVDSILTSGDGRTPQTAFIVISVAEEYSILRVLQMKPTRHVIMATGVDALHVQGDVGVAGIIYFNPAAHIRRLGERSATPK